MLHIYRSPGQSLTSVQRCPWIARGFKLPALPPNRLVWARCCGQRRPAKNCFVQHYYDTSLICCSAGKGCKHPDVVARQKRRLAMARSRGAAAGWRTRRARLRAKAKEGKGRKARKGTQP